MIFNEQCPVLGVTPDATPTQIKAAFRERAKQYHPDYNKDPDAVSAYQRVVEAYHALQDRPSAQIPHLLFLPPCQTAGDPGVSGATDDAQRDEAIACVRAVMARSDLAVLSDGCIRVGLGPQRGYGPDDEQAWLARPAQWNLERLHDAVMIEARDRGPGLPAGVVKLAVRQVIRDDRRVRENFVMRPLLYDHLDDAEQALAAAMWAQLSAAILDLDPAFGAAVLQHFIWQVKGKQLGLPICHHLMPIIVSPVQGSGKTTFVTRFLGPLEELASATALLSDLADSRSGEILESPVVFVDDVERLDPGRSPVLKSLLTAEHVSRRQLGSSRSVKWAQRATLIGTANEPVGVLIPDPTGHRRFAELPFRNGAVARGGNAAVWRAVDETDYGLLWRSVDGFGPSPILPHLDALAAAQAAAAPVDELRECLVRLDLRSDGVQNISIRGGVRADDLRLLVCGRLGKEITNNRFSARMTELVNDPDVPFEAKKRASEGLIYPLKHRAQT